MSPEYWFIVGLIFLLFFGTIAILGLRESKASQSERRFYAALESISEDDFKEFWEEHDRKAKLDKEFFETEAFLDIYKRIISDIEAYGIVDDEDMLYHPEKFTITPDEFYAFTRCLLANLQDENKDEPYKDEGIFIYKDISMFRMHGQGTCTQYYSTKEGRKWKS